MSDKAPSAVNQQGSLRQLTGDPSETTRRTPIASVRQKEIMAYLQGAMHDASLNKGKRIRFVQKYREWLVVLQNLLAAINVRSWIYKEGKTRDLYVLETVCPYLRFDFDPRAFRRLVKRSRIFVDFLMPREESQGMGNASTFNWFKRTDQKLNYLKSFSEDWA